jgi:DNA modification methylase
VVLDLFAGSGTVLSVALRMARNAIGIELNPAYCKLARARVALEAPPMFTSEEATA